MLARLITMVTFWLPSIGCRPTVVACLSCLSYTSNLKRDCFSSDTRRLRETRARVNCSDRYLPDLECLLISKRRLPFRIERL
jgi:hypothetical protein